MRKFPKKSKKGLRVEVKTEHTSISTNSEDQLVAGNIDTKKAYLAENDQDSWNELHSHCRSMFADRAHLTIVPALVRYRETHWAVMERQVAVDIREILKARKRAVPETGHSISRIVFAARHMPEGSEVPFYIAPEIVSLVWSADGVMPNASHPTWDVDNGSAASLIDAFCNAPALLAKEAKLAANAANIKLPKGSRSERSRALDQIRMLLPLKKGVFGVGEGDELIQHALVKPLACNKVLKRDPDALSREDVMYLQWDEAFQRGLPRPQRVKI